MSHTITKVGSHESYYYKSILTKLKIVQTELDINKTIYDRADAFCGLPGGLGTLEEIFEATTWTKFMEEK